MNADLAISLLRTVLQIGGTYVAANGIATADQWTAISGALITLVATGWTVVARWHRA